MALQVDVGDWTITIVQSNAESFNDTFDEAPVDLIVMASSEDKKKSMAEKGSVSTTGADIGGEVTGIRYLAKAPGFSEGDANQPQMDSGTLQVALTKILESVSFNDTFDAAPIVITGYYGTDADWKGGKTSAANITTTGADVASEIKETGDNCNWIAVYTDGFFDPA